MELTEKTLSQRYEYKGRIISLRVDEIELPNGKKASREVIEHGGGVCVAALTEDDELLMVRQFRYPYMEEVLEVPAGKLEKGEDPLECGKRELLEESGAAARKYYALGTLYPSPGYCGEVIHMYFAEDLTITEQSPDEDEFLDVEKIPLMKAVEMILSGEIKDAKTQAAIMKVYAIKQMGKGFAAMNPV